MNSSVSQISPTTLILGFPAEVTVGCVETIGTSLREQWESHAQTGARLELVELDLSLTKHIDSAGLSLLSLFVRRAQERGAPVQAIVGSSELARILRLTRFQSHMKLIEAEDR